MKPREFEWEGKKYRYVIDDMVKFRPPRDFYHVKRIGDHNIADDDVESVRIKITDPDSPGKFKYGGLYGPMGDTVEDAWDFIEDIIIEWFENREYAAEFGEE